MKRLILICIIVGLLVTGGICWMRYPWIWVIEHRVEAVGPTKLVVAFDAWPVVQTKTAKAIEVADLPPSLRELNPVSAVLRSDGVYLILKTSFVEEDGVFIASPGIKKTTGTAADPSWFALGDRVYRYHISG